jgi:RND family efflux transporter MFP subunit
MKVSRRIIGSAAALLVLSLSGAGIYYRVSNKAAAADGESGGAAESEAERPEVSANAAFETDMPIPVEGAQVIRGELVLSVSAAGEAASFRSTPLRAQVSGQVKAVHVRENAATGGNQVLVEIDPAEYELAVRTERANLARAQATFQEQLVFNDRLSPEVRQEREKNARVKAGVEGAEAAVQRAEMNLARTRVRAPFAGRVANVKVVPGQFVTQGEELLTVQQMDPIEVEVQVLESEIGFLTPGRRAALSFAAYPGEAFSGMVETINPVVDQKTRTAKVSVSVRNPQNRLLPGMYARVSLAAQRLADRILVPRTAVLERDHRTMLFVLDGDGSIGLAKWRYVTTGLQNETLVEIVPNEETEMVEPGETVLVGGHYTLTHDARVRLTTDSKAEGGRPQ